MRSADIEPHVTISSQARDLGASEGTSAAEQRDMLLAMLLHQQRLAQSGLLMSGLAHDIGNQVTGVLGNIFLALRSNDPAEWREALELAKTHCTSIGDTMRAYMSFAKRRRRAKFSTFSLSEVVNQVQLLSDATADASTEIECRVVSDADVVGDRTLAVQALMNLVLNAAEATSSDGGRITIEARRVGQSRCRIQITDDGPGIPEAMRPGLFRPFTTGRSGRGGSGLGLFLVRSIVRALGGRIHVRTSGDGTTFRIDLPALPDAMLGVEG
ncbi:MAG: HAMP domain-containing sensor histidine kinase [Planctomycetota bacterium]|nr:HAMP domain-containing sensor histidine kinase [Planctomycetota bacterium]